MLALDTEDDSNGHVTIINFFDGVTHSTFTGPDLQARAWNWLRDQEPENVWCCNTEYDLINLFGNWVGKLCTIQYARSGFLRATFREARITFFETYRHWPMKVEDMGVFLGLPKLPQNFQSIEYCQRDTEIVWRFVNAMLSEYDALGLPRKATLPATALALWKQTCAEFVDYDIPASNLEFFREGYYGGRVEVYRFGTIKGPIYHYDINSLFPAMMQSQPYPDLSDWKRTGTPDFAKEGMARVLLSLPDMEYPPLPIRRNGELVFAYGNLYGVWSYPEIRKVLSMGGTVESVDYAIEFSGTLNPFSRYVELCYKKRLAAKAQGDELRQKMWKLFLNSLYGKFGQTGGLFMIHDDKDITLQTKTPSHVNVIWSAYTTAYARLCLHDHLTLCKSVYYTDTDSLFTDAPLGTGTKLGELKHEGTYRKARFLGNKIYTAGHLTKAKGVPEKYAPDFIREGRAIYRKPMRLRESRRVHKTANVWYEVEKSFRAEYTKRRRHEDGSTSAWNLRDYEAVVMSKVQ